MESCTMELCVLMFDFMNFQDDKVALTYMHRSGVMTIEKGD